jgi:hypothetical protein
MDAVQRTRRLVGHSGLLVHVFFKHPAVAELSDDILGVEEASGRMTPAGSRPRSQSPHIWGQFRLGPHLTPSPIEPKNRCCSTGPCIVPTTGPGWRLACVRCQCRCSAGFAGTWWSRGAGGSHRPASRRGGQWVRGTAIPSIVAVGVRVDDA